MECVRFRIKDVEFENHHIIVRDGKGGKDRATVLLKTINEDLRFHLKRVRKLFEHDVEDGCAGVYMPHALAQKYPGAGKSWIWQWVFPAKKCSRDPRTGKIRRHHTHEAIL